MNNKNKSNKFFLIMILISLILIAGCKSNNNNNNLFPDFNVPDEEAKVLVYYFYGDGCPACTQMGPHIDDFIRTYTKQDVNIHKLEVWHSPENQDIMKQVEDVVGMIQGVPATIVGDELVIGASPTRVENLIKKCLEQECNNIVLNLN
jgi:thiol-disulfide isomerase/thioredoxin